MNGAVLRRERTRTLAPALGFAALVLAVWADPIFTGRNFTGRDLIPYNLPMEKTVHEAYAAGTLPIWNPYISGGRPLMPNPNCGAIYPIRPLLALLRFPAAMRVYTPLHWIAAGVGMLVLLGSLGIGTAGALLGAVTYVFSGPSVSEVFYTHIQPGFALLPWIVWALARRRGSPRTGTLLLAVLFGVDFLAADVFTGTLAIAVCVLWTLRETPAAERRGDFGALVAAIGFGALLAAPQIAATAMWIPETNRAVLGMKLSEAILFSVSPWRLLELVIPYPFGATWELQAGSIWAWGIFNGKALGLFSTLFVGALGPIAAVRLARRRAPGLAFARWLVAIGLAVSVLPSLIPAAWRNWSAPVPLRNPEKLVIGVVFGMAILVARALDDFRVTPMGKAAAYSVGGLFAAAAVATSFAARSVGAAAGALLGTHPAHGVIAAAQIPGALAEGGLLWMATVVGLAGFASARKPVRVAAVALLSLVPITANRKLAEISHPAEAFSPTAFARRVQKWDPSGSFRVLGESIYHRPTFDEIAKQSNLSLLEGPRRNWYEHTPALWGRGMVFNYDFDAGDLSGVESLRKVSTIAAGFRDAGAFFGNLSLRWGIRRRERLPVAAYRPIGGDAVQEWDRLDPAYPDIRLAERWRQEPDSVAAFHSIAQLGPGELVLETGKSGAGAARPGNIRITEKHANRLAIEAASPDDTWLFVLRAYWPYRRIEVDGRRVEAVPAYLAFSAVPLPAGHHRILWREEIPGIAFSIWGPVAFLVFAAGMVLWKNRRGAAPA